MQKFNNFHNSRFCCHIIEGLVSIFYVPYFMPYLNLQYYLNENCLDYILQYHMYEVHTRYKGFKAIVHLMVETSPAVALFRSIVFN